MNFTACHTQQKVLTQNNFLHVYESDRAAQRYTVFIKLCKKRINCTNSEGNTPWGLLQHGPQGWQMPIGGPAQRTKIKISPLGQAVCYLARLNKFLNSLRGNTFCQHLSTSFWGLNFLDTGSCNTSMQHLKKKTRAFASLSHSSHMPVLTQSCTEDMLYIRRKQLANIWKCCLLAFF